MWSWPSMMVYVDMAWKRIQGTLSISMLWKLSCSQFQEILVSGKVILFIKFSVQWGFACLCFLGGKLSWMSSEQPQIPISFPFQTLNFLSPKLYRAVKKIYLGSNSCRPATLDGCLFQLYQGTKWTCCHDVDVAKHWILSQLLWTRARLINFLL